MIACLICHDDLPDYAPLHPETVIGIHWAIDHANESVRFGNGFAPLYRDPRRPATRRPSPAPEPDNER